MITKPNKPKTSFNYIFFNQSIKLFQEDLNKFSQSMFLLPEDILLDLMAELVALKEMLESLESGYLKKINSKK
jgi:hypothetical protein